MRMKDKIIALGILLAVLLSGMGTASAHSNAGGGEWRYYREIAVKEEKAW